MRLDNQTTPGVVDGKINDPADRRRIDIDDLRDDTIKGGYEDAVFIRNISNLPVATTPVARWWSSRPASLW